MKMRLIAAAALLAFAAGCAQLGIPTPSGFSQTDPEIYESSLSD
jgi:hypothetical protein